ncbi:MAG: cadmium-translocating P-type ATPase [Clostridia bacterium]|nr:cadmium-translocating P-type ATPase [Clostridia bacterium]
MNKKQKKTIYKIAIAIVLTIVIFFVLRSIDDVILHAILDWLYLIPYFVAGGDVCRKAFRSLYIHGQFFDENLLMVIATGGAFGLGEMVEGVAVMVFYQIGELFQSIAIGKSRQSISNLMDIMPEYANLLVDGEVSKVDPDEVEIGNEILIYPGERIPLDGVVVEGSSSINTSALTGESLPRDVSSGDEVLSGCINMNGLITIKTTKEFEESTATKILELVESSAMNKAKSENFITRFARVYTPAVCFAAIALAVIPPLLSLGSWETWGIRALTFLVISCPCALVISIPLSFFAGIGSASSKGILVKGSNYLENLSKVKYMVMDKTGTLTKGVFKVQEIFAESGYTKEEVLEMAAYAEIGSNHPIGLSIKEAYGKPLDLAKVKEIEDVPGKGIKARVNDRLIMAGNMSMVGLSEQSLGTTVYVNIDGNLAGKIVIADEIKEEAKEAVVQMKKQGIKKVFMLTGDSKEAALKVKDELGLDGALSNLLPQDKVDRMEDFIEAAGEKELVAFVGDGINDAPVLARSDVGIAMGALGQDAAIEAADVVLMDDNPKKIALAMQISKKTIRIVKENIVFALLVKFACLLLGAIGIANMWMAIFADVGVMIIAVINATRAMR